MAAGSWLQHRALHFTLFSLISHLHRDKRTALPAVCCKGNSLVPIPAGCSFLKIILCPFWL